MNCPYCGASVQKDARFCGDCGKPLAVPLTVAMHAPAMAAARPSAGQPAQPPAPSLARPTAPPGHEDSAATTLRRVVNTGAAPAAGRRVTSPTPAVAPSLAPAAGAPPVSAPAAPAVSAAAPAVSAAAHPAAPPPEAGPVRASAFLDAVESPVARVLRIVLLLVLDAGLIGVGTYYLYQFIRLSPAAAAPSITIGQPSLVRGQEAGQVAASPPAAEIAAAPGAPAAEGAVAGEPPRAAAVAAARPARGGKASAPPAELTFGGARPSGTGKPVAAAVPTGAARPAAGPAEAARRAAPPAAAPSPAPAPAPAAPAAARDDDPGEVEAQIDAESVRIIMRQHKGDVRACYNQGLKANPDASGTIEVRFAIDAQGRAVKRRVITDTVGLPGVGDCIVGQLGRWQFPRPVGGEVEFVYPFILSPGR